jgi:glyoxylase-like metal-dependent hydrolase (beta-lactamase superfamily II)
VIFERSTDPRWLSNSYLIAGHEGGEAVVIDAGAPAGPLLVLADMMRVQVTHVLLTHHHVDHVAEASKYVDRYGAVPCAHEAERDLVPLRTAGLHDDQVLEVGGLTIRVMHVPGHTRGQVSFVVGDRHCFTGDTLFKGSVGGTRHPGHGTFAQLRESIMGRLMALPPEVHLHPGHGDPTTVGHEWEHNPFVRAWRGLEPLGHARCTALGEPATLLLWVKDYDGGHKAWVRFDAGDQEDVVPGSRVVHLD